MDKTKLIEYLAALSHKYDPQLVSRNIDPNKIRNEWYQEFHMRDIFLKTYETITEEDPLFECANQLGIHDKKFTIYYTGRDSEIDCACWVMNQIFNIIWYEEDSIDGGCFYKYSIVKSTSCPPVIKDSLDIINYYIDRDLLNFGNNPDKIIDFLDIINKKEELYGATAIVYLCDIYGYENVIKHVKQFS